MNKLEETISKTKEKKEYKKAQLFAAGYNLFVKVGINNTTINDIVNKAGIAKGTFYLYFRDKWQLHEELIIKKSYELFYEALLKSKKEAFNAFDEEIIFMIDYIINKLQKNKELLLFIDKNLSIGFYSKKISDIFNKNEIGLKEQFMHGLKEYNVKLKNPEVTLYMIIELVSSTCFSSIVNKEPLPIDEYKPYLYSEIKKMIKEN